MSDGNLGYLIINKIVTFDTILLAYELVESFNSNQLFIIYEVFKNKFKKELENYRKNTIKNMDDIYSLDDEKKIFIKNFMKDKLFGAINSILIPFIGCDLKNIQSVNIEGCFILLHKKEVIVGVQKKVYFSSDLKQDDHYINIYLVKNFILNNIYNQDESIKMD